MPSFGTVSKKRLVSLCDQLTAVAYDAINVIDFSVIETVRCKATQDLYIQIGASTLEWPNSKHNVYEGRPEAEAMDLWPYIPEFGALSGHPDQIKTIAENTDRSLAEAREFVHKAFARVAGVIEACAATQGFRVQWGGDWDGDGNLLDQNFHDLPHFELKCWGH